MRTFWWAALAFVAGTVATYIAVVGGMFWYIAANNIFDRDGGMSMGIVFILGPVAGLIGGTICAVVTAVWRNRRAAQPAASGAPAAPARPQPLANRVALAVLLVGVPVYAVARLLMFSIISPSFRSYWIALVISYLPALLGLAAGAFAAHQVVRKAMPPA